MQYYLKQQQRDMALTPAVKKLAFVQERLSRSFPVSSVFIRSQNYFVPLLPLFETILSATKSIYRYFFGAQATPTEKKIPNATTVLLLSLVGNKVAAEAPASALVFLLAL
jgi:hypothetical protein